MAPHRRRPQAKPPRVRPASPASDGPSLFELDRFSHASLTKWLQAAEDLGRLQSALYFGLESARQERETLLLDALRAGASGEYEFTGWSRIVDFRYSLDPLSVAGSLRSEGGRFNIGGRLSPGAFTAFPALYLAQDFATACCERFGQSPGADKHGLTGADLALRRPGSFTQVQLQGRLDLVLDIADPAALKHFVDVIRAFELPDSVRRLGRRLGLRQPPGMVRTVAGLRRQLLQPNWRMLPMQYDLPSNSQVFGRIAAAAGVHGILYPSARLKGRSCVAVFPQNWRGTNCFVEVSDPVPPGARLVRLDGQSVQDQFLEHITSIPSPRER